MKNMTEILNFFKGVQKTRHPWLQLKFFIGMLGFFGLTTQSYAMADWHVPPPHPYIEEYYGAFSTETAPQEINLKMFEGIPNTRRLGQISMLGTHNSATKGMTDIPRTQTLSISDQLRFGVRFLDLRLKHVTRDKLLFYHGDFQVPEAADFSGELLNIKKFLDENPSEFVMIRIKNEDDGDPVAIRFGVNFATAVNKSLYAVKARLLTNKFIADNRYPGNISLEDARGKIIILADYYNGAYSKEPISSVAQPHLGETFSVYRYNEHANQDDWWLKDNWSLYGKIEKVIQALNNANMPYSNATNYGFINSGSFYFNYFSGSGGSFPYFVAGGRNHANTHAPHLLTGLTENSSGLNRDTYPGFPRYSCTAGPGWVCSIAFAGVNEYAAMHILKAPYKHIGVIVADFPGSTLIRAVKHVNAMFEKSGQGAGLKMLGLLKPHHSGKCLDIEGASHYQGARLIQWDCNNGTNQNFTYTEFSDTPGFGSLKARHSNMCLDVSGGGRHNGTGLIQWDCHNGNNQRFTRKGDGSISPAHAPGKCLDVEGGTNHNGAKIVLWDCHGGANQRFSQ